jgi:hypothetical protein
MDPCVVAGDARKRSGQGANLQCAFAMAMHAMRYILAGRSCSDCYYVYGTFTWHEVDVNFSYDLPLMTALSASLVTVQAQLALMTLSGDATTSLQEISA